MSFGLYISGPPPLVDNVSFQSQNNLPRVSLSRTGLCAKTTMETTPEFLRVFQNMIFGANLDISDHLPGKVFINEWAYGSACPTIKAVESRINAKLVQLLGKSGINDSHSFSSS
jgi:hypothetical protein